MLPQNTQNNIERSAVDASLRHSSYDVLASKGAFRSFDKIFGPTVTYSPSDNLVYYVGYDDWPGDAGLEQTQEPDEIINIDLDDSSFYNTKVNRRGNVRIDPTDAHNSDFKGSLRFGGSGDYLILTIPEIGCNDGGDGVKPAIPLGSGNCQQDSVLYQENYDSISVKKNSTYMLSNLAANDGEFTIEFWVKPEKLDEEYNYQTIIDVQSKDVGGPEGPTEHASFLHIAIGTGVGGWDKGKVYVKSSPMLATDVVTPSGVIYKMDPKKNYTVPSENKLNLTSTTLLSEDTWYHVAIVKKAQSGNDKVDLYINGTSEANQTWTNTVAANIITNFYGAESAKFNFFPSGAGLKDGAGGNPDPTRTTPWNGYERVIDGKSIGLSAPWYIGVQAQFSEKDVWLTSTPWGLKARDQGIGDRVDATIMRGNPPNPDASLTRSVNYYGYFRGLLNEIRVSEKAMYTANFTAPTSPFKADDGVIETEGGDPTLKLLIKSQFDGTSDSTITEFTGKHTVTNSGNVAQKHGGYGFEYYMGDKRWIHFPGYGSCGYLKVPHSEDFNFADKATRIDFWVAQVPGGVCDSTDCWLDRAPLLSKLNWDQDGNPRGWWLSLDQDGYLILEAWPKNCDSTGCQQGAFDHRYVWGARTASCAREISADIGAGPYSKYVNPRCSDEPGYQCFSPAPYNMYHGWDPYGDHIPDPSFANQGLSAGTCNGGVGNLYSDRMLDSGCVKTVGYPHHGDSFPNSGPYRHLEYTPTHPFQYFGWPFHQKAWSTPHTTSGSIKSRLPIEKNNIARPSYITILYRTGKPWKKKVGPFPPANVSHGPRGAWASEEMEEWWRANNPSNAEELLEAQDVWKEDTIELFVNGISQGEIKWGSWNIPPGNKWETKQEWDNNADLIIGGQNSQTGDGTGKCMLRDVYIDELMWRSVKHSSDIELPDDFNRFLDDGLNHRFSNFQQCVRPLDPENSFLTFPNNDLGILPMRNHGFGEGRQVPIIGPGGPGAGEVDVRHNPYSDQYNASLYNDVHYADRWKFMHAYDKAAGFTNPSRDNWGDTDQLPQTMGLCARDASQHSLGYGVDNVSVNGWASAELACEYAVNTSPCAPPPDNKENRWPDNPNIPYVINSINGEQAQFANSLPKTEAALAYNHRVLSLRYARPYLGCLACPTAITQYVNSTHQTQAQGPGLFSSEAGPYYQRSSASIWFWKFTGADLTNWTQGRWTLENQGLQIGDVLYAFKGYQYTKLSLESGFHCNAFEPEYKPIGAHKIYDHNSLSSFCDNNWFVDLDLKQAFLIGATSSDGKTEITVKDKVQCPSNIPSKFHPPLKEAAIPTVEISKPANTSLLLHFDAETKEGKAVTKIKAGNYGLCTFSPLTLQTKRVYTFDKPQYKAYLEGDDENERRREYSIPRNIIYSPYDNSLHMVFLEHMRMYSRAEGPDVGGGEYTGGRGTATHTYKTKAWFKLYKYDIGTRQFSLNTNAGTNGILSSFYWGDDEITTGKFSDAGWKPSMWKSPEWISNMYTSIGVNPYSGEIITLHSRKGNNTGEANNGVGSSITAGDPTAWTSPHEPIRTDKTTPLNNDYWHGYCPSGNNCTGDVLSNNSSGLNISSLSGSSMLGEFNEKPGAWGIFNVQHGNLDNVSISSDDFESNNVLWFSPPKDGSHFTEFFEHRKLAGIWVPRILFCSITGSYYHQISEKTSVIDFIYDSAVGKRLSDEYRINEWHSSRIQDTIEIPSQNKMLYLTISNGGASKLVYMAPCVPNEPTSNREFTLGFPNDSRSLHEDLLISSHPCQSGDAAVGGMKTGDSLTADVSILSDPESLIYCPSNDRIYLLGKGNLLKIRPDDLQVEEIYEAPTGKAKMESSSSNVLRSFTPIYSHSNDTIYYLSNDHNEKSFLFEPNY